MTILVVSNQNTAMNMLEAWKASDVYLPMFYA